MKSSYPIRWFLFWVCGVTPVDPREKMPPCPLVEPDGVRTSRRNIIALTGLLVLAGLADAHPSDLNVFGVKPGEGTWGVIVIGAAAVAVQLYWYSLKYWHLKEDGRINVRLHDENPQQLTFRAADRFSFKQKSANLFANRVAFILTIVSWYFVGSWVCGALRG